MGIVPSKTRPHPPENNVSPVSARPAPTNAIAPSVWPGIDMTVKRDSPSVTTSPSSTARVWRGMRARSRS